MVRIFPGHQWCILYFRPGSNKLCCFHHICDDGAHNNPREGICCSGSVPVSESVLHVILLFEHNERKGSISDREANTGKVVRDLELIAHEADNLLCGSVHWDCFGDGFCLRNLVIGHHAIVL